MNRHSDDLGETTLLDAGVAPLPFIIGVGASAGGLEALTQMLAAVSGLTNLAVVIVQHLSADYKSMMPELLARHTEMEVVTARDGARPMADTVYVIEPDTVLSFSAGRLRVQPAHKIQGQLFLPINELFESLAKEQRGQCAVVVLSGTGSDGSSGLRAAKTYGAVTICQSPDTARFDGMPRAAMATGATDLVLSPDHVLPQLMQMRQEGQAQYFAVTSSHGEVAISRVLSALRSHTKIDFNHYKPATILRRVERRMHELGIDDTREYADRLYQDAAEAMALRRDLLIGVTRFLRDDEAIDAVRTIAMPRLAELAKNTTLRIWVAACSTGEEAYSLAMLLQEALDAVPDNSGFKMFATDVNPDAIERASAGEFSAEAAEQLPPRLRQRFFTKQGGVHCVTKALREKLLFSRHDLIQDPPFSHIDMISCRNLLIYLKPALQDRVMRLFSTAINDGGILWLGASEVLGERSDHFQTLDARWRLYAARSNRNRSAIVPLPTRAPLGEYGARKSKPDPVRLLLEDLQREYVPPCLVLDVNYRLHYRFGALDALLRFPSGPVSLDVREILPAELSVLVTALISKARDGGDVVYRELTVETPLGVRRLDLRARSVSVADQEPMFALFFEGLREVDEMPQQLSPSSLDVEARDRMTLLERELRQTRESLQATVEEVESSNEELQATNEELIASNEELQSTNEELQSVNEELHTVNAEYSEKLNELTRLNQDMDQLFASLDVGILLLDDALTIRRFNTTASLYFNVLPQDVGRPLIHLAHRLSYPSLLDDCAHALRNPALPISRHVSALDDRTVQVQLRGHDDVEAEHGSQRTLIITIADITAAHGAQQQLGRLVAALEQSTTLTAVIDANDQIVHANSAFASSVGCEIRDLLHTTILDVMHPSERDRTRDALLKARAGARWRGVVRSVFGQTDRFDLVRFVQTRQNDASVIRIAEQLVCRFVPYDKDRREDEPMSVGTACYCVWSSLENQRVVDPRVVELLDLRTEASFNLEHPEYFASPQDAPCLQALLTDLPGTSATKGYRFVPLKSESARVVQLRACSIQGMPSRLLLELVLLPSAARGFRS